MKWLIEQLNKLGREVGVHMAASGALKGFITDQTGALQASWFHTLSNADEAIFETVKRRLYLKWLAQGAPTDVADETMKEFELYMAGLNHWQSVLYRLTVVIQKTDDERLLILERMFECSDPDLAERNASRDRIIQNIIGDEPLMHQACEYVKANYRQWAKSFISIAKRTMKEFKHFLTKTVPAAVKKGAQATDQFLNTHVAPHVEAKLSNPVDGWAAKLEQKGAEIKTKGGI